ncbi:MAG: nucleoside triphosphate pyrophosphohydrolase [Chitinophagales bacterium]|nr:nucleoside triphosphate pyrophosphohydrolase [Chitinophagales bacterium]MCO5280658.1 nucleoside triphosphate pyrophosphohydrolase [Chitinophagales bacterium]OJV30882.1 MAG: nucleoside triphosphate pyrophosphohydrolase [Bacteroidetes bacterium 37-13]HRN95212.1 nucleoside triphosphate pyrophosphohydrolase [Chitinophagales bacterium]HRP39222.1 nucleoside triphosphate pyrophosphohydrolase [Chitinophagales bacterium]
MQDKLKAFERILNIMNELREKCPWDKKQTMDSLRILTIEEVYELNDAIAQNDLKNIKEELGDLLLHIVFYTKIAEEQNAFNMAEMINGLCEKLIARHPHIYGDVKVENEEQVKQNWEKLKLKEGKKSVLAGVPKSLPALPKAQRIQDKAKQVGFDWEKPEQVWEKVQEEIQELQISVTQNTSKNDIESELGDVLFSIVNYARFLNIDPEAALEKTNKKFIHRFQYLETKAQENNKQLSNMTLAEMDIWWNEAKKEEIL